MPATLRQYELTTRATFLVTESPTAVWYLVMDRSSKPRTFNESKMLERYLNDVYQVFLYKLTKLTHQAVLSTPERNRLRSLLNELLRVKALLQGEKEES